MAEHPPQFDPVTDAIAAIGRGEVVVVVDDEDRENEGDLIMAAEFATPEKIAFFVRHTSGLICVPMTGDRLDELDIPLMVRDNNTEAQRTAFTYSVDATNGKLLWTHDMLAASWGSALIVDGKVYVGDEDGDVTVFKHGREMEILSEELFNAWF